MIFPTSIAGSLPKPSWLAEPEKLWAPWRLQGDELAAGQRDATLIWLKEQEDAGIDIVTDGEQSRIHFVHGFLERIVSRRIEPFRPGKRATELAEEKPLETSLYMPVKRYLEKLGFQVKGEICGCDLVALRENEPVIVIVGELKLSFNLELLLQGIDRISACDEVWLAVRTSARGNGRERDPRVRKLCRLLGFGLLVVSNAGRIDLLVEPGPWRPRRDPKRRSQLVEEHQRRHGDPVLGGSSRTQIMTAYRQQALLCAAVLASGPGRPRDIKPQVPDAPKILLSNVYGWFVRVERGLYALTDQGRTALIRWPQTLPNNPPADTISCSELEVHTAGRTPIRGSPRKRVSAKAA